MESRKNIASLRAECRTNVKHAVEERLLQNPSFDYRFASLSFRSHRPGILREELHLPLSTLCSLFTNHW